MTRLTVLLPFYNSGKYLRHAVRSVLNQTFAEFEFVIIDDGSTDNSEDIILRFKDPRIIYIKKEHTGLADSLNYGLKVAKTDIIVRMDSDDTCDVRKIETQYNFFTQNKNYDIIGTNINVINKKESNPLSNKIS